MLYDKTAAAVTPATIAGLGAGGLIVAALANHAADLAKQRWLELYRPSWKAQGEARAWGQEGGAKRYTMGQETFSKAMFEAPVDLLKDRFTSAGNRILDMPGDAYNRYKVAKKFDEIRNDPSVQAMGEAKARALYGQVARLAPDLIRKAPSAALPAIQNALLTDSTGLRADYVYNMARAQDALNK